MIVDLSCQLVVMLFGKRDGLKILDRSEVGTSFCTRTSMMPYFKQTCSIKKRYPREFGWTLPSLTPIARLICFLCPDFRAPHADFSFYILKEHPRSRWSRILNISRTVHTQRNIFIYIYIYFPSKV